MSALGVDANTLGGIASCAIAITLLDAYDISGAKAASTGATGTAGALVAAAMSIVGPWYASLIGLYSAVTVHLAHRNDERSERFDGVLVRIIATAAAVGTTLLLAGQAWWLFYLRLIATATVFLLVELAGHQARAALSTGQSLAALVSHSLSRQSLLVAAEISASALAAMLYHDMWITSVLSVAFLLVLIRQSFAMLAEIGDSYRHTVSALVDVAEASEFGRKGHSERVAAIASAVALKAGLGAAELDRIEYAALLHDVSGIAESREEDLSHGTSSAEVVGDVGFLAEVVPLLRLLEGRADSDAPERDLLATFIVALASDVDCQTHGAVAKSHDGDAIARVGALVPARLKARAVSAAVGCGFPVPAID